MIFRSFVGRVEDSVVVGFERDKGLGPREAEAPNQLTELVGERCEESEGLRRHCRSGRCD